MSSFEINFWFDGRNDDVISYLGVSYYYLLKGSLYRLDLCSFLGAESSEPRGVLYFDIKLSIYYDFS